jgi:hypothetical protein
MNAISSLGALLLYLTLTGMQSFALASAHYWPERDRWAVTTRYAYGVLCIGIPWSVLVLFIAASPRLSVALFWLFVVQAGALTTAMYARLDPWLARRRAQRSQTASRGA